MEKFTFKYSTLEKAIERFVDELYGFDYGYKVVLNFWRDGSISNTGIISYNSDIIYNDPPVFQYWERCTQDDDDKTDEDIQSSKDFYFDYIYNQIKENLPENIVIDFDN